jgi:hypothetical protein
VVRVGDHEEIALVDVAVVTERYIGARALWRTETFRELFVTFADPEVIGMSAIAGLLTPVTRLEPHGLHVRLAPEDEADCCRPTRTMRTIREFEERCTSSSAVATSPASCTCMPAKRPPNRHRDHACTSEGRDRIASTHRGHGHCIAKGVDPPSGHDEGDLRQEGGSVRAARAARCTSPTWGARA